MRIFLDANILFSAAKTDGTVRRLLATLSAGRHVLCADAYVAEEARRNLAAKSPQSLPFFATLLDSLQIIPADPAGIPMGTVSLPEKDRPVLGAAIRGQCNVLLTGDRRDFGRLLAQSFAGVTIHSPQTLAALLFK